MNGNIYSIHLLHVRRKNSFENDIIFIFYISLILIMFHHAIPQNVQMVHMAMNVLIVLNIV